MKRTNLILILALFSTLVFAQKNDVEKDKEAIKKVIQTAYVEGLQNEGDISKIDAGIHSGFNLLGIGKENEMWNYTIKEWKDKTIKKKEAGKLPKKGDKEVTVKFLHVDVTGTAGIAKIEFYVGKKLKYVDYISLYKFKEGWKMVNKIYYQFPEKK